MFPGLLTGPSRVPWRVLIALGFVLTTGDLAQAGPRGQLFDRPVKLDPSGRPLYNSWERQEYQRRMRQPLPPEPSRQSRPQQADPGRPEDEKNAQNGMEHDKSNATKAAGSSAIQYAPRFGPGPVPVSPPPR